METGATSELISSSTDSDVTDNEVAFIVKLKAKQPISKEVFDEQFDVFLEGERSRASSSSYTAWLSEKSDELYRYSFNAYTEGEGTVTVSDKPSESAPKYFN